MTCPHCQHPTTQVRDTDRSLDGREVVRRRQCPACHARWHTRELVASRLQSPLPETARHLGRAVKSLTLRTTNTAVAVNIVKRLTSNI